jgi:hypothetical protein
LNGGTFSTVTVTQTGNLIGNNLTLAAGPGGGVTKVSVSGAASLTNTAINMDPGGAGRGIIANGAGTTVVLGSGSLISQTQNLQR